VILSVLDLQFTSWIGARISSTNIAPNTAADFCIIESASASELVKMDPGMGKSHYDVSYGERYGDSPTGSADPSRIVQEKGIAMGEAADMYGDLTTAEDYGYVSRGYVEQESYISRSNPDSATASNRGTFNSSLSVAPSVPGFSLVSVVPSPKPARYRSFWATP